MQQWAWTSLIMLVYILTSVLLVSKYLQKFSNYDKKTSPSNNPKPLEIEAPKTIERLEKISHDANKQRKAEEAEEDDDDDEKIKIFDSVNLELDKIDIHSLDKTLKLEPDPILTDVEILG